MGEEHIYHPTVAFIKERGVRYFAAVEWFSFSSPVAPQLHIFQYAFHQRNCQRDRQSRNK